MKRNKEETAEASDTPPPSPLSRRPRHPLSHSQSLRPSPKHQPQCDCDRSLRLTLTKSFHFWAVEPRRLTCSAFQPWVKASLPRRAEATYANLLLISVDTKDHRENLNQIEIDLSRTYPDEPYFGTEGEGREVLRQVLTAFANYDPAMGYVQGMNFIAAALLWHTNEIDCFWLLIHLMEEYDLRDNYGPSLPGLTKHCQIVNLIMIEHLPKLHMLFCEHRIASELFITDWCFTMFGSMVPVQDMGAFFTEFLSQGWPFFYKVVLVVISRLESRLLQSADISDILSSLRPPAKSQRHWREFISHLERGRESLSWRRLFAEAKSVRIDEGYIHRLHYGYRSDSRRFGILE